MSMIALSVFMAFTGAVLSFAPSFTLFIFANSFILIFSLLFGVFSKFSYIYLIATLLFPNIAFSVFYFITVICLAMVAYGRIKRPKGFDYDASLAVQNIDKLLKSKRYNDPISIVRISAHNKNFENNP